MQKLIETHSFLSKADDGEWQVTVRYYDMEPIGLPTVARTKLLHYPVAPQEHFNLTNCFAGQRVIGKVENGKFILQGLIYGLANYSF
jgi:hypothetical protein